MLDPADREVLAEIRRAHEELADDLTAVMTEGEYATDEAMGLWGVLETLVTTTTEILGSRSMLNVLIWSERHAAHTYEAAMRISGLSSSQLRLLQRALHQIPGHIIRLEGLLGRYRDGNPQCMACYSGRRATVPLA